MLEKYDDILINSEKLYNNGNMICNAICLGCLHDYNLNKF